MKRSKLVLALYAIAGILGITTIIMVVTSISYLGTYAASYGMSVSDMGAEAVQYVLSSSVNYLIYGILIFAAAKILETVQGMKIAMTECCSAPMYVAEQGCTDEECECECGCGCGCQIEEPEEGAVPPLYTSKSFMNY